MTVALRGHSIARAHPWLCLALALALAVASFLALAVDPPAAHALLKSAANSGRGTPDGDTGSTYTSLTNYFNQVADAATWLAIPGTTLGSVVAGGMMMAGNPRAGKVAFSTVVGLGVIISSKAIAS